MGANEVKLAKVKALITGWEKLKTEKGTATTSECAEFGELRDYTGLFTERVFGKKVGPSIIAGSKTVGEWAEFYISKLKVLQRIHEDEAEIEKAEDSETIIATAEIEEPEWIKKLFPE